jgi:hypothetical protein
MELISEIQHNFSLSNFISYSSDFKKLFKQLNEREKRKAFDIFIDQIINKIKNEEKIKLLKSLRQIDDNEVFEWTYRNEILKIINTYLQDIKTLEEIINYDIFEGKLLISLENDKLEIKEIIQKWELDYLRRYNNFYSKLSDEKWWLSLAFEVDGKNPVESVIYDIVQKLSRI